jgi:sensor histidine kinase YesM
MTRHLKFTIWIFLSGIVFGFSQWLFGIAMPEIALQFAVGTTFVVVAGLFAGRTITLVAIKTNPTRTNWNQIAILTVLFIIVGFLIIAFLLGAMIDKTTLFPFAVTVFLLFLINAAFGAFVTILRHQYQQKVQTAQAFAAQSRSELQLLQSQLSPHFLFNTLNNLYGLSLSEPDKLPTLLLKLSELLRYSVYEVKEMFVPLQQEVDYIRNYIAFERLRLGDKLQMTIDIEALFSEDVKIPPQLLVVFVENAFKHSRTTGNEKVFIEISLKTQANDIIFSVSNSVSTQPMTEAHPDKHSGFGLASVRKRLNLLYAQEYKLVIDKTSTHYKVLLTLRRP